MANGWGGARRNSGPKKGSKYALPRPELKPRAEFMSKVTSAELLTPIEVMHDNMVFYHLRAGEILAAIMPLPTATRDQQSDAQFEAMKMMADHFRMRDKAGEAANMLARYVHRPLAAIPHKEGEKAPAEMPTPTRGKSESKLKQVELIPLHPAADAAFKRAAQGLPPLPRKQL